MNNCDVVIVNFNAGKFLTAAVRTTLQSSSVEHIIIVDNASTDNSLDQFAVERAEQLTIIRNKTNVGFAAACNIGLAHCKAEYILLLNPDCCVQPWAIERLIEVLASDVSVGICGPLLLNPDGSEQAGGRRVMPTPWRSLVNVLQLWRLRWLAPRVFSDFALHRDAVPNHPIDVDSISGACMMLRHSALDSVGAMDEGYFLHCEDLDWCLRFRQGGWRVLFVPDAKVVHEKGVSSEDRLLFTELHKHRGMIRFYRKFFRDTYPAVLFGVAVFGVWVRFAVKALGIILFHRRQG